MQADSERTPRGHTGKRRGDSRRGTMRVRQNHPREGEGGGGKVRRASVKPSLFCSSRLLRYLLIACVLSALTIWILRSTSPTAPSSATFSPPPSSSPLFPSSPPLSSAVDIDKKKPAHTKVSTATNQTTTQTKLSQAFMWPALARRVVVIGGGLAGQSAAIEAATNGAHVLLLEKEARLGGNSAKATSGINGWGTAAQRQQGIEDSGKYFERDTFYSGRTGNCDPGLVKMLSVKSADAVGWLSSFGIPLTVLSQLGGASRKRCHRAPDKADGSPMPIGFTTVSTLEKHIRANMADNIHIEPSSELIRLLFVEEMMPNGDVVRRVNGVEYRKKAQPAAAVAEGQKAVPDETVQVEADAVILATGGFSNDHTSNSLLDEYAPNLTSFPTTNGPWATGDGVKVARELDVQLVDMDKVQLHPTGLLNPKEPNAKTVFLGPEALRGSGGILLNSKGERFVNELELRSVVSQAIIAQKDEYPGSGGRKFAYCVLNDPAADLFGRATLGFYWKRLGLFTKVENVAELAKLIGCPEDTVKGTLQNYEHLSTQHAVCALTGKNVFPCVLGPQGPFYVAYVTPSIHYTMGGCLISPSAEIQSSTVKPFGARLPILGLFGAGEVTGGVHGGNRLGGNSLLECVVFGRIAGLRASQSAAAVDSVAFSTGGTNDGSAWAPLMVREVIPESESHSSGRQVVFSLPSSYHRTGLSLLQPVLLRGTADGQKQTVQMIPSTPPSELGAVAVFLPSISNYTTQWLHDLQPGDIVEARAAADATVSTVAAAMDHAKQLYIIATAPHGVGALMQLLRAALEKPLRDQLTDVHLVYAANQVEDLSYRQVLEGCRATDKDFLHCSLVLNEPPAKWTEGVGVLGEETLHNALPPATPDTVIVVAGETAGMMPIMDFLEKKGYAAAAAKVIQLPL